jgi:hypothetical protein
MDKHSYSINQQSNLPSGVNFNVITYKHNSRREAKHKLKYPLTTIPLYSDPKDIWTILLPGENFMLVEKQFRFQ